MYVCRRSNYIAVLAVAPASDNLPLYHVTYVNLQVLMYVCMYVSWGGHIRVLVYMMHVW